MLRCVDCGKAVPLKAWEDRSSAAHPLRPKKPVTEEAALCLSMTYWLVGEIQGLPSADHKGPLGGKDARGLGPVG